MMNTEKGGKRVAEKRRVHSNQAKRKARRRRNQTATATTIPATHSHSKKRKNKPSVMWTCMNSFNNAVISKKAFICIKVPRQKVPLLLSLYDKGEFFVVAHQRYAIRKRIQGDKLRVAAFAGDQLEYDIMELYPGYLEDHFNIHKLSIASAAAASPAEFMTSASAQFAAPLRMGMYERPGPPAVAPMGMWSHDPFKVDSQATSASTIMEPDSKFDTGLEDVPQVVALEPARSTDQETSKPPDKATRRLAQNREAARKSRLRKKAYIQQLETSRIKLAQLEQELQRARQQGAYNANGSMGESNLGFTGPLDAGVAAFEIQYGNWVDMQNRHTAELRNALQGQTTDLELRMLVETGLKNYDQLFQMKSMAAHSDVFYVVSGMWTTPAERFFLWIGGFRPSDVLKVLRPQLEPLTESQEMDMRGLEQTSTQFEDALHQGMDKLQHNFTEALVAVDVFASSEAYMHQMVSAVGRLKELVGFVTQADQLRYKTLEQMHKILTTRQAARALLALGDYFQRLRALSQLWAARPRESAIS